MRVQHDALGADRVDGVAEPDEQAFEVVLAGLLDLAALDVDVVDASELPSAISSSRSKPSERDVCGEFLGALLERHEDAGLAELGRRR